MAKHNTQRQQAIALHRAKQRARKVEQAAQQVPEMQRKNRLRHPPELRADDMRAQAHVSPTIKPGKSGGTANVKLQSTFKSEPGDLSEQEKQDALTRQEGLREFRAQRERQRQADNWAYRQSEPGDLSEQEKQDALQEEQGPQPVDVASSAQNIVPNEQTPNIQPATTQSQTQNNNGVPRTQGKRKRDEESRRNAKKAKYAPKDRGKQEMANKTMPSKNNNGKDDSSTTKQTSDAPQEQPPEPEQNPDTTQDTVPGEEPPMQEGEEGLNPNETKEGQEEPQPADATQTAPQDATPDNQAQVNQNGEAGAPTNGQPPDGTEGQGQEQGQQKEIQERGLATQAYNRLRHWDDINEIDDELEKNKKDKIKKKKELDKIQEEIGDKEKKLKLIKLARFGLLVAIILLDIIAFLLIITIILAFLGGMLASATSWMGFVRNSMKIPMEELEEELEPKIKERNQKKKELKELNKQTKKLSRERRMLINQSVFDQGDPRKK